jgi:hypothetical protein
LEFSGKREGLSEQQAGFVFFFFNIFTAVGGDKFLLFPSEHETKTDIKINAIDTISLFLKNDKFIIYNTS